jgi:hypothetical protein
MSGALQAVFQNQRSFGLKIGDAYQGGFYAGQISTAADGIADYNLVVGPLASAQNNSKQWKILNNGTSGTSSVIDGPTNSSNMNNATHPAAQFCEDLTIGGFSDWYMPAINELEVCYYNLKPTTNPSFIEFGGNVNSVPKRTSNYTTSNPAQTSAGAFKSGGSEAFDNPFYWSSTENNTATGTVKYFKYGSVYQPLKTSSYRVRAIRRVAV